MNFPHKQSLFNRVLLTVLALLLGGLFFSMFSESDSRERMFALRLTLFALSGIIAFILPYLSFPDRHSGQFQILNLAPSVIHEAYFRTHRAFLMIVCIVLLMVTLGDIRGLFGIESVQLVQFLYSCLFTSGLYMLAAADYLKIGSKSQQWREGDGGGVSRPWLGEITQAQVAPGSVPSLIISVKIAVIGMMGVVTGAWLSSFFGFPGELSVAILLFAVGIWKFIILRQQADRYYYQTNAFFGEFFGTGSSSDLGREALAVRQLWWIPKRWKAHSWALMLELDRRIPSGRIIAVGHLFLWIMAYQGQNSVDMLYLWAGFAVCHHALLLFTASESLAPIWWLRHLDSGLHWVLSRFWAQVRWVFPVAVGMGVMKVLFGYFTWAAIGWVCLLYLVSGALISLILSLQHERRWAN